MKILYLSHSFIPARSANSIHVMKMCQAFAKNGHQVDLVCAKNKKFLERDVVDIFDFYGTEPVFRFYRLLWPQVKAPTFFYALQIGFLIFYQRLRGHSYDLMYGRFLLGSYLACLLGYKVVFELHAPSHGGKLQNAIFEKLIHHKNMVRFIVISQSLKDEYQNDFAVYKKTIVAHDAADEIDLENTMSVSPDYFHVGYVGHLYKGRGIKMLLDIAVNSPWLWLHIVGGTETDITYWKAEAANVKNVTFYGFCIPKETARFRASMDVLVAPYEKKLAIFGSSLDTSKWMSPLKIFEYMAAKKAIICSDIPVLHEVLTDHKNALLCEPESTESWIKALLELKNNPLLRKEISATAYNEFITKYTWNIRARNVITNLET